LAIKRTSSNSLVNATKMSTGFSSAAIPNSPTIGVATSTGATTATVTYTAASLGALGSTFTATSSPSSITGTGASPITVSGLSGSTNYTFTVRAINANGNSPESASSNQITTDIASGGMGYYMNYESGSAVALTNRVDYSNDTISNLTGNAIAATPIVLCYGCANSGTAGYLLGAYSYPPGAKNTIVKFTFSGEASSVISATLSGNGYYGSAVGNKGVAGYLFGGVNFGSAIQRLDFSSEVRTTISATTTSGNNQSAGLSNSGTAGYKLGGGSGATTNIIEKFIYSGETISTIAATLTNNVAAQYAFSNNTIAGYVAGGQGSLTTGNPMYASIDKLVYSTDTKSALAATMQSSDTLGAGCSNTGAAGYMLGGINGSTRAQKLTYSTDTRTTLAATMSTGVWYGGAFANETGV